MIFKAYSLAYRDSTKKVEALRKWVCMKSKQLRRIKRSIRYYAKWKRKNKQLLEMDRLAKQHMQEISACL